MIQRLLEIGTVKALPIDHCPHRPGCRGYCSVASLDDLALRGQLAVELDAAGQYLMRRELVRRGLVP